MIQRQRYVRRITIVLLSLTILMGLLFVIFPKLTTVSAQFGEFEGGAGSETDPFTIATAEQLNNVRNYVGDAHAGTYFKLINDIDLKEYLAGAGNNNGKGWEPIGEYTYNADHTKKFQGNFDGGKNVIKNLWVNRPNNSYIGLFGHTYNSEIKDIGVILDTTKDGLQGESYIGSIAGCLQNSVLKNSYAVGKINGLSNLGGLTGWQNGGTMENCYSDVTVTVRGMNPNSIGGLIGFQSGNSMLKNSYAIGPVAINANNRGGVIGWQYNSSAIACFFDKDTTGQTNGVGSRLGNCVTDIIGKNTAEMKQKSTYIGWDFTNVWKIDEGNSYPILKTKEFAGGTGTEENPFLISTPKQLNNVRNYLGNNYKNVAFKLINDIDLTAYLESGEGFTMWATKGWEPIGTSDSNNYFQGIFDGDNHTIRGLWCSRGTQSNIGLFGSTDGVVLKNIALELNDAKGGIYGDSMVGALVADTISTTVDNCHASGKVTGNTGYVGGLIGQGNTTNSYFTGSVTTNGNDTAIGGLIGSGSATNSYFTGSVTTTGNQSCIGGLIGYGTATNSYSTGSILVNGNDNIIGGLVGIVYTYIKNNYTATTLTVNGTAKYIGGLVGDCGSNPTTIENCYFNEETTGLTKGVGNGDGTGVIGLTTKEMTTDTALTTGGKLENLGSGFVKRRNGTTNRYYPELALFYGDGALGTEVKENSEKSIRSIRTAQTVENINVPEAVTAGQKLNITAPIITWNTEIEIDEGWESSQNGIDGWETFNPNETVDARIHGHSLRYFAEGDVEKVYSNVVTVTVNRLNQTIDIPEGNQTKNFGDTDFDLTVTGAKTSVRWESSDPEVATIDPNTGNVHIVGAGTTTITATAQEDNTCASATAQISLTVNKANLTLTLKEDGTEITEKDITYGEIDEYILTVEGTNTEVIWNSSDETVATVTKMDDSKAKVKILKAGNAVITVTAEETDNYNEISVIMILTITRAEQSGFKIDQSDMTLDLAIKTESTGTTLSVSGEKGTGVITWNSSDVLVATVDSNGAVTALKKGTVTITATKAGDDNYKEVTSTITINVVDKTDLNSEIGAAKEIRDGAKVGDKKGQYPQSAIDKLEAAIEKAKEVQEREEATQKEIDQAEKELQEAIEEFQTSVNQGQLESKVKPTVNGVKPNKDKNKPATGDDTNVWLYAMLTLSAVVGVTGTTRMKWRRKEKQ